LKALSETPDKDTIVIDEETCFARGDGQENHDQFYKDVVGVYCMHAYKDA
jgi:hypothetical protein